MTGPGPVVVATEVLSAALVRQGADQAAAYRAVVGVRPVVVSFATVAAVRVAAGRAGWNPAHQAQLEERLGRLRVVWPGPALLDAYVELRSSCLQAGHPLAEPGREPACWIAATARWLGVPLVAADAAYQGVDGLDVLAAPVAPGIVEDRRG